VSRGAVKKAKNASPVELKVGRSRTGLGLFTLGPIEKGTHIVEYTGRTLAPGAEYKTRSKYLFRVSKKRVIDGASRSNLARYINHSCAPNCRAEGMRGRIVIVARRRIRPGEELTYHYGRPYFNNQIRPIGCRCLKCEPFVIELVSD